MIAIRGLKMPVDCQSCFARFGSWCRLDLDERMVVPFYPEEREELKPEWCPLVEIPDVNDGNCSEFPNNSDCVSRQTTADAIGKRAESYVERFGTDGPFWEGLMIAKNIVECASSAQPEIILCKDCEYSDFAGLNNKRLYCMKHSSYFYEDDFCSYAVRNEDV